MNSQEKLKAAIEAKDYWITVNEDGAIFLHEEKPILIEDSGGCYWLSTKGRVRISTAKGGSVSRDYRNACVKVKMTVVEDEQ